MEEQLLRLLEAGVPVRKFHLSWEGEPRKYDNGWRNVYAHKEDDEDLQVRIAFYSDLMRQHIRSKHAGWCVDYIDYDDMPEDM